jgi:hypothetical protein
VRLGLQRIETPLHGGLQVMARLAEAAIVLGDEIALRPAHRSAGAASFHFRQAGIGVGDLMVEGG